MLRPATPFEKYVRHPLEALGAATLWFAFKILPVDWASALGGRLLRSIGPRLPLTERARRNIRRVMPDKSEAEVEEIVTGMWENFGRTVAEFPHITSFALDGSDPRVEVTGLEHLTMLRDDGEAGLFYGAHVANWELAPLTALANGVDTLFIYREANNRLVQKLYLSGRKTLDGQLARKGGEGAKQMIRALRDKKHVGMLVDQKMNDGIAVPFFGIDAMTAPALAGMALQFKCPVVAGRVVRTGGARFRVEVMPPVYVENTGDRMADIHRFMATVNATIEGWIREHPDQWLWLHNRWPGVEGE